MTISIRPLTGRLAPEVLCAPGTIFDATISHNADVEIVVNVLNHLRCRPWTDGLALSAAVCACATHHYRVTDIAHAVRHIDRAFARTLSVLSADDWHVDDGIAALLYMRNTAQSWRSTSLVLGSYLQLSYAVHAWCRALPDAARIVYAPIIQSFTGRHFGQL